MTTPISSLATATLLAGLTCALPALAADLPGVLAWGGHARLSTAVSGVIKDVRVSPGQRVEKGETLLILDQRAAAADKARAEAAVEKTRHDKEEAEREMDRAQQMYDRTLLSDHELQRTKIDAASAEAAFREAQAELTGARLDLEYSRIIAPFAGLVAEVAANEGEVVVNRLEVTPLVTLVNDRAMKARVQVNVEQLRQWPVGTKVKVAVEGEWLDGEVRYIGLEPLEETKDGPLYRLEVEFHPAAEQQFRAGQPVTVRLDE